MNWVIFLVSFLCTIVTTRPWRTRMTMQSRRIVQKRSDYPIKAGVRRFAIAIRSVGLLLVAACHLAMAQEQGQNQMACVAGRARRCPLTGE